MRKPNPEQEYAFWHDRFMRIVLTKKPILRWSLDEARVRALFHRSLAPVEASAEYLSSEPCTSTRIITSKTQFCIPATIGAVVIT